METEKKHTQPASSKPGAKLFLCLFTVFLIQNALAQQTYKSRVEGWTGAQADLILPLENPVVIGAIDENGQLQMTLTAALADQISEARQKANDASENLKFRNRTVRNAFYCKSDAVEVSNGETEMLPVSMQGMFFAGIMAEQKPIGMMRLASSEAFSRTYFAMRSEDVVKGSFIAFYYLEDAARVKGVCKTKSTTLDGQGTFYYTHDYDIDLHEGWNMVMTEVTEVYTDQEGRVLPLKYRMKTVEAIPESHAFFLVD